MTNFFKKMFGGDKADQVTANDVLKTEERYVPDFIKKPDSLDGEWLTTAVSSFKGGLKREYSAIYLDKDLEEWKVLNCSYTKAKPDSLKVKFVKQHEVVDFDSAVKEIVRLEKEAEENKKLDAITSLQGNYKNVIHYKRSFFNEKGDVVSLKDRTSPILDTAFLLGEEIDLIYRNEMELNTWDDFYWNMLSVEKGSKFEELRACLKSIARTYTTMMDDLPVGTGFFQEAGSYLKRARNILQEDLGVSAENANIIIDFAMLSEDPYANQSPPTESFLKSKKEDEKRLAEEFQRAAAAKKLEDEKALAAKLKEIESQAKVEEDSETPETVEEITATPKKPNSNSAPKP